MTERLYYTDASVLEFDARVVAARDWTASRRDRAGPHRVLSRRPAGSRSTPARSARRVSWMSSMTATGSCTSSTARLATGTRSEAPIDAARRLDHMQQHTGQHVLSAAFDRLFQNRTLSFHMGADVSTIDVAKAQSPEDVERAVDEANRVVWENRPVTVRFASADEARSMGLRKESVRDGELRLVDVTDFDLSACGGTHVPRTGTIGVIAVTEHREVQRRPARLVRVRNGIRRKSIARERDD